MMCIFLVTVIKSSTMSTRNPKSFLMIALSFLCVKRSYCQVNLLQVKHPSFMQALGLTSSIVSLSKKVLNNIKNKGQRYCVKGISTTCITIPSKLCSKATMEEVVEY